MKKRKQNAQIGLKKQNKTNTYLAINVVFRGSHVRSSTRTITRGCSWTIVLWLLPLYSFTAVTENTSDSQARCWFNFYFPWQYLKRFPRPNEVSSISLRPVVIVSYSSCKVWLALSAHPLLLSMSFYSVAPPSLHEVVLSFFFKNRKKSKKERQQVFCSQHQRVYLLD